VNEKTETARRVLDSHAVLALLWNEQHAATVERVIENGEPWMTLVNLGEVAYIVERRQGGAAADAVWADLIADDHTDGKTIRFLDLDAKLVRRAAAIKVQGGISYADCFAAAAAERLGCPVLTGDPEFAKAEKLGIAVDWRGDPP
jgi:predicted nucleic acid-binding protein